MKVRDIMTRAVHTIPSTATLREAADAMRNFDIGLLPVSESDHRLVGTVTDRDITVRAISAGMDPNTTQVAQIMTPEVATVLDDDEVEVAAHAMERHQVRRVVVLNAASQAVGVLSLGDLGTSPVASGIKDEVLQEVSREDVTTPINP